MNREEALVHFQQTIADTLCETAREEFHRLFLKNREVFTDKLKEGFQLLVSQLENSGEETEIGYIHYSFLRAHVLDGTYQWYVEAQDEKGVFDRVERSLTISLPEFFEPLEKLEQALKNETPVYMGKVTESDIEQIKLREFNRYVGYFYIGGRKAFQNIKEMEEYHRIKKAPLFRITLGERKDKCIILHITTSEPLSEKEVLDKFYTEPSEKDMQNQELTFQDYKGFHFDDRRVVFKNASFSSFRKVKLEGTEVMFCNLIGADFSYSNINESYLNVCTLQDTNFRHAVIQNSVLAANHFQLGTYEKDQQIMAGIYPVSFEGATLTNVDFSGSDLSGCDFTGASLKNVIFTEAILNGTKFEREMIPQLELTEEQKNSICVV